MNTQFINEQEAGNLQNAVNSKQAELSSLQEATFNMISMKRILLVKVGKEVASVLESMSGQRMPEPAALKSIGEKLDEFNEMLNEATKNILKYRIKSKSK